MARLITDDDDVDLTNLQRQIAHGTASVGRSKVASAAESVARINPGIQVNIYEERLTAENAAALFADYDLIADGSDNFNTRYLVNDAAYLTGKPLVSGSLLRFEGQLATFRGGVDGHEGEPCYRCLFPIKPPPGMIPRCEEAGILGAVAGVIGTLQATEVIKELLGLGTSLSGHLLIYDALGTTFRKMKAARDPDCILCGTHPTIRKIVDTRLASFPSSCALCQHDGDNEWKYLHSARWLIWQRRYNFWPLIQAEHRIQNPVPAPCPAVGGHQRMSSRSR